jgi:16S rRNA (uracil1498-N3)-methyltransferase
MGLLRFYCKDLNKSIVQLSDAEEHHLVSVCRLTEEDIVELFDGKGVLAVAKITSITKRNVTLHVHERTVQPQRSGSRVIITPSIAKGMRFDWLISKCTELGVDKICPVVFDRTIKLSRNPTINERWKNLAISAAKQCGRLFLPDIEKPLALTQALELLKSQSLNPRILFGSFSQESCPLINQGFGSSDVAAVIGPEGGITEKEEGYLLNCGAQPVYLTETVLRVETAAITFAAILTAKRDAK